MTESDCAVADEPSTVSLNLRLGILHRGLLGVGDMVTL